MNWTADKTGFTGGTPFRFLSSNIAIQNASTQVGVAGSLHAFYKDMLRLRNTLPSIARGSYLSPWVSGQVMGYQRKLDTETTLVLINYGNAANAVAVNSLPANATLLPRFGSTTNVPVGNTGQANITVPAQSVAVYQLGL
jgi:glycosidase